MGTLIFLVVMVAFLWLVMIRPAQKRQRQAIDLQRSVSVGDEVVLSSGIFGTVVEDTEDHIGIEVADGVTLRVLRGAIGSKIHQDDPEDDPEDEADDTADDTADDVDDRADEADHHAILDDDTAVVVERED